MIASLLLTPLALQLSTPPAVRTRAGAVSMAGVRRRTAAVPPAALLHLLPQSARRPALDSRQRLTAPPPPPAGDPGQEGVG